MSDKRNLDFKRTLFAGPIRVILPIVGYIVLYPTILSNSGPKILGLWSIVATIPLIVNNLDVGFSLLIKRGFSRESREDELEQQYIDISVSKQFYRTVVFILIIITGVIFLFINVSDLYPQRLLFLCICLTIFGIGEQLVARLYAAALSAKGYNYLVQYAFIPVPILTVFGSLVGAFWGDPILGFSIGCCIAAFVQQLILLRLIARRIEKWKERQISSKMLDLPRKSYSLLRRGGYLYGSMSGLALREVSFRYVVAFLFGLEIAGIWDIAIRVGRTVREVGIASLSSLYPSFAFFYSNNLKSEIVRYIQLALTFIFIVGGGLIGVFLFFVQPIMGLWLGNVTPELKILTLLILIWNGLTFVSWPFWILLQATNLEKSATIIAWIQIALTLLFIPIGNLFKLEVVEITILWILVLSVSELLVFYSIDRRLDILYETILNRKLLVHLFVFIVMISIGAYHGLGHFLCIPLWIIVVDFGCLIFSGLNLPGVFYALTTSPEK